MRPEFPVVGPLDVSMFTSPPKYPDAPEAADRWIDPPESTRENPAATEALPPQKVESSPPVTCEQQG